MPPMDIDPADWPDLNRLLDEALDKPAAQRAAWLASLGGEQQAVKARLRELLARKDSVETGEFLETLPKFAGATEAVVSSGSAGDVVGPYRLLRELGSGGMGAVWLAERVDGLINRPVALKLPHLVAARAAGLAERMAREREILATLDHRNIARLLDAGVSADGQPFLALEYVEGVAIDAHCAEARAHAPDFDGILRLFRQVADAVAYAHGKLVIHRDLKPANILVTPGGGVKLLDFGIAKLLDGGETRETRLTEISGRALTPHYASPEQILGQPLTVASDLFSLGVILYELLTGQSPHRPRRDSRAALEEAIVLGDAPRPSDIAPAGRRKLLRGDLDNILLKALRRQPTERYTTVNGFSEDLSRHLEDLPVRAQAHSGWYRLRKFVARNALPVGAGAAVSLALLVGAGIAIWQGRVAVAERDRAVEVERFIAAIFRDANPYGEAGRIMTAVDLLRGAHQEVEREFSARPELRIALLGVIGESMVILGDTARAEQALQSALRVARDLHGAEHAQTLQLRGLLTDVLVSQGDAAALGRELADLERLTRGRRDLDAETRVRLVKNHANLAFQTGRYDEAAPRAREALDLAMRTLGARHALTVTASSLLAEAQVFGFKDVNEMLADTERALRFVLAAYPDQPMHSQIIRMREVRGRALGVAGHYHEAIREQAAAIDASRQVLGTDNFSATLSAITLSAWERRVGALEQALAHSGHSLAALQKAPVKRTADLMQALTTHGVNLVAARRSAEAERVLRQAEQLARELFGATHWDTLTARLNHAVALAYLGRHAEAADAFGILQDKETEIALPWWAAHMRGIVHRLAGQAGPAAEEQARALSLIKDGPRASWDRMRVWSELGLARADAGDLAGAREALDQAGGLFESLRVADHAMTREVRAARARLKS
jgi:eukaryotic-like serine/threonine-protein kinase